VQLEHAREDLAPAVRSFLTLSCLKDGRFFLQPASLTECNRLRPEDGPLSRSVAYCRSSTRFRLPGGTVEGQFQDVKRSMVVTVKHQPTGRTDMSALRERPPDPAATARALLCGVARRDGYHRHTIHVPVGTQPEKE